MDSLRRGGRLAQLAEHIAHIDGVAGSSPAAAIPIRRLRRIFFWYTGRTLSGAGIVMTEALRVLRDNSIFRVRTDEEPEGLSEFLRPEAKTAPRRA